MKQSMLEQQPESRTIAGNRLTGASKTTDDHKLPDDGATPTRVINDLICKLQVSEQSQKQQGVDQQSQESLLNLLAEPETLDQNTFLQPNV